MQKPSRRWFQFGLQPLILLIVVCAVALTWWRQYAIVHELQTAREQIRNVEEERSFHKGLARAFQSLNFMDEKHRHTAEALQRMRGWPLVPFRIDRVVPDRQLEVLLFSEGAWSGTRTSVAILLSHSSAVDTMIIETATRLKHHEAEVRDVDEDGAMDLVCEFGEWGEYKWQTRTVVYNLTSGEFIERAPEAHTSE